MSFVLVEIWSDVVCPWCYIGKRRFETALAQFEHRDEVVVRWRSFELDPSARPSSDAVDYPARLARKYRVTREQAEAMIERITREAEGEGLRFRLDIAKPGNTFDAHRVIHFAEVRGVQDAVKEALLSAYQVEGQSISEPEVMATAAAAGGLDRDEVLDMLETDAFELAVRVDEEDAMGYGATGVPFFVFDRRFGVPGAQSPDVLLRALRRSWDTRAPLEMVTGDGEVCGPEGCE